MTEVEIASLPEQSEKMNAELICHTGTNKGCDLHDNPYLVLLKV